MLLINIKAFLEREHLMNQGMEVDRRTKVLEFRDDETTTYAILSHRWIDHTEVDYGEMVNLAKMDKAERDEIRGRLGYRKICDTCEQARKHQYEWVWIDTCCIDKRSSAELSEAINSMYRWYENSRVCYVYLHDVSDFDFPIASDESRYPKSNGWPEWFSRGWTLQEMIAPKDVWFFNKNWQLIGDKRTRSRTLSKITRVPGHILEKGLSGNRPCVAQVISWAAYRMTKRVEDRAYSLMGLLDVNMPMLYGEGKKAFHRLQLELIRTSNDQSIFAWGRHGHGRTGSILADDPTFFADCADMELIDHDEFIHSLKFDIPEKELPLIERDLFGTFPITNRGIHIWMFLRCARDSDSVFEAVLPCRTSWGPPETICLGLWNSNYYRYSLPWGGLLTRGNLQFRQVYLRYQDSLNCDVTFEVDDSAMTENGFTYCNSCPSELKGNMLVLTGASPLCVRTYSNSQGDLFAVAFGQCFSQGWIHVTRNFTGELPQFYERELVKGPERAQLMADAPSRSEHYGRIWVHHVRISNWIVRTSRMVWERSRIGVRIEAFRGVNSNSDLNKWRTLDVEVRFFLVYTSCCYNFYRESVIVILT